MDVPARLHALRVEIARCCVEVGRSPESVRLLGVTKGQPIAAILAAIAAGLTDVGESYVQEAATKDLAQLAVTRHFIGRVQRNKAAAIVAGFDVVQSIDRLEAGEAIARATAQIERRPRVLVQVNVSSTERFGVTPAAAPELAERLRALGLGVDGLMAIGPRSTDRDEIRRAFTLAARTFALVGGSTLSIGMSGDWREAIAAGSTMIRLGTAIFGARA